jgi:DSF synthase
MHAAPAHRVVRPVPGVSAFGPEEIMSAVVADYGGVGAVYDPVRRSAQLRLLYGDRPCYTIPMMAEITRVQEALAFHKIDADHVVWTSSHPTVFCLGGDLATFVACIRRRDVATMRLYGKRAVDNLYSNAALFPLHDVETIACVRGDAFGGGMESVLSCTTIVAERSARFALPEMGFNLFPGMGALNFLANRIGIAGARRFILDPKPKTAEEAHRMGIVDILSEDGEGLRAAEEHVARKALEGHAARLKRRAAAAEKLPAYDDLIAIVLGWADTAMGLDRSDLKRIDRIVGFQNRLAK